MERHVRSKGDSEKSKWVDNVKGANRTENAKEANGAQLLKEAKRTDNMKEATGHAKQ